MSTNPGDSNVPNVETCPNCKGEMTITAITPVLLADDEDVTYKCKRCLSEMKRTFSRAGTWQLFHYGSRPSSRTARHRSINSTVRYTSLARDRDQLESPAGYRRGSAFGGSGMDTSRHCSTLGGPRLAELDQPHVDASSKGGSESKIANRPRAGEVGKSSTQSLLRASYFVSYYRDP